MVRDFRDTVGPARGVNVSPRGFRHKYGIMDQIQYVDFSSRELQRELTPLRALEYLRAGNERFRTGKQLKRDLSRQVVATAVGQHPVAGVLSCIDSRSPAELLFDLGLGDVFSVRVAGNICTTEVLGSLEFACAVAGAKLVVVLGHTRCGAVNAAVKATCNPGLDVAPGCGHLAPIVEAIGRAVDSDTCRPFAVGTPERQQELTDAVARRNVALTVGRILDSSGVLRDMAMRNSRDFSCSMSRRVARLGPSRLRKRAFSCVLVTATSMVRSSRTVPAFTRSKRSMAPARMKSLASMVWRNFRRQCSICWALETSVALVRSGLPPIWSR
jgi:carbonic anhydrase